MFPGLDTGGGGIDAGSSASGDSGAIYGTNSTGSKNFNFGSNPYLAGKANKQTMIVVAVVALSAYLIYKRF
jgi:hypothetical protein